MIDFDVTYHTPVGLTNTPVSRCVLVKPRIITGSITRLFIYSAVPLAAWFPQSSARGVN